MPILLSTAEVKAQSNNVWNQFGESEWLPKAKINSELPRKNTNELGHCGIGKFAVLAGMGSSLEKNAEAMIKHREKFDLICCDKAFGPLLEHGLRADMVIIADTGIPFKYLEPYINETKDVPLICTPYANTEWTTAWKGDRYFYINMDAIESEKHFIPMFHGQARIIPASSNVSNAMLVFFTDCNDSKNDNWGGYEKYALVGYDYSWPINGNYYAWQDPKPKRYYMNHMMMLDLKNNPVFTSSNLLFSLRWMYSYVTTFNLPVVNCSGQGLLDVPSKKNFDKFFDEIKLNKFRTDQIRNAYKIWKDTANTMKNAESNFHNLRRELTYGSRV
jgi:hypothetical protein